jgi:transposase-like protein DUF772
MLIQVFFSMRSERKLMEQVRHNLLYRWFIGLAIDDQVWTSPASGGVNGRPRPAEARIRPSVRSARPQVCPFGSSISTNAAAAGDNSERRRMTTSRIRSVSIPSMSIMASFNACA